MANLAFQISYNDDHTPSYEVLKKYYYSDLSIVGLNNGGFVATWNQHDFNREWGQGMFARVQGQVYDSSGVVVGSEFELGRATFPPNDPAHLH